MSAFAAEVPDARIGSDSSLVGPPASGFVTNAETAVKIALAVYEPIHGAQRVEMFRPYEAFLSKDIWVVQGRLRRSELRVAIAHIAKEDGRVLKLQAKPLPPPRNAGHDNAD